LVGRHKMVRTIVTSFDRRLTLIVADVSVVVYWPRNLLVNHQVVNNVSTATQKQKYVVPIFYSFT
jgi:hypothetical protein